MMKLLTVTMASLLTVNAATDAAALKKWEAGQLAKHNELRKLHGGKDLTLDADLTAAAQKWSNAQLAAKKMSHDTGLKTGENLAFKMDSTADYQKVLDDTPTQRWYDEIKDYDFTKSEYSSKTGHFTQVVWAKTTKLGCGSASDGNNVYVTCRYEPAGNVVGEFKTNVLPLEKKAAADGSAYGFTTAFAGLYILSNLM